MGGHITSEKCGTSVEIVSGLFLLLVSPSTIDRLAHTLTAHELGQDAHDRIANYILHTTAHLSSGATLFAAVYLLIHGVAKVVLVAFVLRGRLWAYPWLMGLLAAFIAWCTSSCGSSSRGD